MKISYLFLTFNSILSYESTNKQLIEEFPEVNTEEYEDQKPKNIKLTYKTLNIMFLTTGLILAILYFCNQFFIDTIEIIDSVFFTAILLLNMIINWMTKQKSSERNKYSKKSIVCLLTNFLYLLSMLVAYTLAYVMDKIEDCNLFTGAKDCHSDYTLFQYICTFLMLLILLLKTFF